MASRPPPTRMRAPIGSCPARNIRTNRWFTIAASAPGRPSCTGEGASAHQRDAEHVEVALAGRHHRDESARCRPRPAGDRQRLLRAAARTAARSRRPRRECPVTRRGLTTRVARRTRARAAWRGSTNPPAASSTSSSATPGRSGTPCGALRDCCARSITATAISTSVTANSAASSVAIHRRAGRATVVFRCR